MSKTFSEKNDKYFDVRFSSTAFVLSSSRVVLSDESSKTLQKTFYKKIVSKSFHKKSTKKLKPMFFLGFVLSRFLGVSR
jgi:hypothetical protein